MHGRFAAVLVVGWSLALAAKAAGADAAIPAWARDVDAGAADATGAAGTAGANAAGANAAGAAARAPDAPPASVPVVVPASVPVAFAQAAAAGAASASVSVLAAAAAAAPPAAPPAVVAQVTPNADADAGAEAAIPAWATDVDGNAAGGNAASANAAGAVARAPDAAPTAVPVSTPASAPVAAPSSVSAAFAQTAAAGAESASVSVVSALAAAAVPAAIPASTDVDANVGGAGVAGVNAAGAAARVPGAPPASAPTTVAAAFAGAAAAGAESAQALAAVAPAAASAPALAAGSPAAPAASAAAPAVSFQVLPDVGADDDAAVTLPLRQALPALGARPANVQDVQRWSDQLTQALRQGGFPVGQVLMTQPDWDAAQRTGQYVFSVFPGRISQITVKNTSRVDDARLQRLITHALCGADVLGPNDVCLLRTARLERATQLLQDVPGVGMAGAPQFAPGSQAGETQVTFALEESGQPMQVGVVLDNNGIPATGRARAGVSASGNNVFHAGDAYGLTLMDTEKHMWTGAANASTPLGSSGLRLAGSVTRQQYSINSVTPVVGVSTVFQGGVQYPFTRGLDSNVWGGIWLLHNRAETNLTDYGVDTRSSINSLQFSLQADNGDRAIQLRANRWSAQGALTVGHDSNNDPGDVSAHRAGNYAKLTGRSFGSYGLNASGDWLVTGQINGQVASRNLDGSEQLTLGGPGAVRAYRADEGSVDEGAVLNLGLYRRFPVAVGHQLQFGAFVDVGYGRVLHSPWANWDASYVGVPGVGNVRVLSGYGLSVDWLTPFGATVSLAAARPFGFSPPSWVDPGKKPIQYWLTVAWNH